MIFKHTDVADKTQLGASGRERGGQRARNQTVRGKLPDR